MENKRVVTLISMSDQGDRAEVVVKTTLANGKMRSVTRHIHKKPNGEWAGIVSSDAVVRSHAEAGKQLKAAQKALEEARNVLRKAAKTHQEATNAAAKDPSDKVRAKANTAERMLKEARKSLAEAQMAFAKATERMVTIAERSPLIVGYSI